LCFLRIESISIFPVYLDLTAAIISSLDAGLFESFLSRGIFITARFINADAVLNVSVKVIERASKV
jgi:hypothetical protein